MICQGVFVLDRRDYMKILSEQMRWKKAVPIVTKELETHIEEQKKDFMADGMSDYEAEMAAVAEMGDPVEVGVDMDRLHRPRMNWPAIAAIGILSVLGLAVRYFLDMHFSSEDLYMHFAFGTVSDAVCYIVFGLVVMAAVCYIDYTRIAYYARELTVIYFILLTAGGLLLATPVNGSRVFITIYLWDAVNINLRMAVQLFIPLYCAVLYCYRGEGYKGFLKGVLWSVPMLAVARNFSLSSMVVIVPTVFVVLSAAVYKGYFKVDKKKTLIGIWSIAALLPAVIAAIILKFGAGYQAARLHAMLDPKKYEAGYQISAVRELVKGSRFIGQGANLSELADTVPDRMSFVLAYITAYYGVLAAVLIIGVIILLFYSLAFHAWKQSNQLGMLMGVGCGAALLMQVAWYVLCNMGVIIAGALYCPFITHGGSGAVVTYILLGIMLSIYRYQNGAEEVRVRKADKMFHRKRCHE